MNGIFSFAVILYLIVFTFIIQNIDKRLVVLEQQIEMLE